MEKYYANLRDPWMQNRSNVLCSSRDGHPFAFESTPLRNSIHNHFPRSPYLENLRTLLLSSLSLILSNSAFFSIFSSQIFILSHFLPSFLFLYNFSAISFVYFFSFLILTFSLVPEFPT